ncbi:hypothetical protein ES703_63345 [subsurface metagenome]
MDRASHSHRIGSRLLLHLNDNSRFSIHKYLVASFLKGVLNLSYILKIDGGSITIGYNHVSDLVYGFKFSYRPYQKLVRSAFQESSRQIQILGPNYSQEVIQG